MLAPRPLEKAGRPGVVYQLAMMSLVLALQFVSLSFGASAQTAGDRWITLGTRTLDARSTRIIFDVRSTKGALKAARATVKSGLLTLTAIEIKYSDGTVYREPRALILRPGERTQPIDNRGSDRFIDTVTLTSRLSDTPSESVVIVLEGLQSAAGSGMLREAPVVVSAASPGSGSAKSTDIDATGLRSGNADQRQKAEQEERAQLEATRKAAEEVRRREAEFAAKMAGQNSQSAARPAAAEAAPPPPPAAPGFAPAAAAKSAPATVAGGAAATATLPPTSEPWDVVPVYYGTDRVAEPLTQRASYGSGRAKRLEVGRALVTVPKRHEVPNVERPWAYRLPFTSVVISRGREDPKLHFTLKEVQAMSREAFLAAIRERLGQSQNYKNHALVFVHGFNTSFDNALFRMAQISYDLKFDGAPFVYSWPSKGALGPSDYSYDRESTGQAEPHLRAFIELVARETGATSVSIIAHSMGNQLLLPVLRDLKRAAPPGVQISQVILAAPDVDRDTFEFLAKEITGVSSGVTMLAAASDRALEVSRRFWGGVPRAGDVPSSGPVVVAGIDTIDVTAISTELFSLNHSGYAQKAAILGDIQALIQSGLRPPEKRWPTLVRMPTDKGDYWRFPRTR